MLAANIENLARDVQSKLENDGDFLSTANELVRNNLTFVFSLGEFYATKQMRNKAGSLNPVSSSRTYHNVRDSHGRFTRKTGV